MIIHRNFVSWPRWWTSFQSWWRSEWRPPDNVRISEKYLTIEKAWASSWWDQKRLADSYSLVQNKFNSSICLICLQCTGRCRQISDSHGTVLFQLTLQNLQGKSATLSDFRSDFRPLIEATVGRVLRTWTRGPVDRLVQNPSQALTGPSAKGSKQLGIEMSTNWWWKNLF